MPDQQQPSTRVVIDGWEFTIHAVPGTPLWEMQYAHARAIVQANTNRARRLAREAANGAGNG